MAYLITTHGPDPSEPTYDPHFITTRCAVTTLDEAQDCAQHTVENRDAYDPAAAEHAATLPESGGTVGPLPDGTTITVKPFDADDYPGYDLEDSADLAVIAKDVA